MYLSAHTHKGRNVGKSRKHFFQVFIPRPGYKLVRKYSPTKFRLNLLLYYYFA